MLPQATSVRAAAGMPAALLVLAGLTLVGLLTTIVVWPKSDPDALDHVHPELDPGHPHLKAHAAVSARHAHDFVIDDLHTRWPSRET